MPTTTKYEYRIAWVDDDAEAVNASMKRWADAGWELVSGSAVPWVSTEGFGALQTWHAKFVTYWKKEKDTTSTSDS